MHSTEFSSNLKLGNNVYVELQCLPLMVSEQVVALMAAHISSQLRLNYSPVSERNLIL